GVDVISLAEARGEQSNDFTARIPEGLLVRAVVRTKQRVGVAAHWRALGRVGCSLGRAGQRASENGGGGGRQQNRADDRGRSPSEETMRGIAELHLGGVQTDPFAAKASGKISAQCR